MYMMVFVACRVLYYACPTLHSFYFIIPGINSPSVTWSIFTAVSTRSQTPQLSPRDEFIVVTHAQFSVRVI